MADCPVCNEPVTKGKINCNGCNADLTPVALDSFDQIGTALKIASKSASKGKAKAMSFPVGGERIVAAIQIRDGMCFLTRNGASIELGPVSVVSADNFNQNRAITDFICSFLAPVSSTEFIGEHLFVDKAISQRNEIRTLPASTLIYLKFGFAAGPERLIVSFCTVKYGSTKHVELGLDLRKFGGINDRVPGQFLLGTLEFRLGEEHRILEDNIRTITRLRECSEGASEYIIRFVMEGLNRA